MPKIKITNNLDNLSFNKAFAKSRKDLGAGQTFKWRGARYTTNYKSEEDRNKLVQDSVVKASNEKTLVESPEQRKKVNTALDLQDQIVNTETKQISPTEPFVKSSEGLDKTVKRVQDQQPATSWFRGEEGLIPDEVENFFKNKVNMGQNLIKKAGDLIDFDNDLIQKTVSTGTEKYNKAKDLLVEVSDDLQEVATDGVETAKVRARNIANRVNELTNTVKEASESELDQFKNKLNDNFLNNTLLPFIQRHVPWGDIDEDTKKIIENPQSTTETLTDKDKTNLFTIFNEKVIPKVTQIGDDIKQYFTSPAAEGEQQTGREFLNEDVYPFIRDKMFGVLPMPIRQALVQRANITEENMSDEEKLGLYMAYKNAVTRGDDMVKYKDYGSDRNLWKQFQGGDESLIDAGKHYMESSDVDKGAYNMMMTIGGEHFREEDGNIIFDQGHYDFNKRENVYDPEKELSAYGKLRNFMGTTGGVTEDDPTKASINITLNRNQMEEQLRLMEEQKTKTAQASDNAPYIYQNIPQNIIPLLLKSGPFQGRVPMRNGGVRKTKGPIKRS